MRRRTILVALLALALAGCSSAFHRRDWSDYTGPGAQYFHQEELAFPHVDDPLEPANRILAGVDLGLTRYVFSPLGYVYRAAVPHPIRVHLGKAGENLVFPTRFFGNLLQGKWKATGVEVSRFVLNTTVGVLGLFDPAAELGLQPSIEDFGQAFAAWGWKDSLYLYLPVFGPNSLRDSLGALPDNLTNPANYFFPAELVRRVNRESDRIEKKLRFVQTRYDAYELTRTLYTLDREVDVTNFTWRSDESSATQTLDSIFLTYEEIGFPGTGRNASVRLDSTGRKLPYTTWLQPQPAPLVYVIPGLGGHRLGDSALGLAELFYREGNSVVTVSNPTNWEFVAHGSTASVPGYVPRDSEDLRRALAAIEQDLQQRRTSRPTSRRLAGISLGGFQALYLAATEEQSATLGLAPFDVYLALDPPVNFEHGLLQLDRFYNAPLVFPVEERAQRIDEIFGKVLYLSQGELDPGMELPFTRLESEFLIGLSFRTDLQSVILQTQTRHDMGILRTSRSFLRRAPAFREASEYSFMEYMHAFVLRNLAEHEPEITFDEAGARRMFERCDLRALADGLRANERVRVFANENDFLLRPEDKDWLRELLDERVHFFPAGGHLGNLHRKEIQEVIRRIVERADDGP